VVGLFDYDNDNDNDNDNDSVPGISVTTSVLIAPDGTVALRRASSAGSAVKLAGL